MYISQDEISTENQVSLGKMGFVLKLLCVSFFSIKCNEVIYVVFNVCIHNAVWATTTTNKKKDNHTSAELGIKCKLLHFTSLNF